MRRRSTRYMCYCEFNDVIDSIAALDADVISIETSRSNMELLSAFTEFKYPSEIGAAAELRNERPVTV